MECFAETAVFKNFMRLKSCYCVLLLATCCLYETTVFCQPIENHFTHYTAKDGMADGLIASIIQDSSGFLWIGNENGLSRFDGHAFKVYRYTFTDTNSLRENRILHLFIDSKKRLWAISFHWLYLYHPENESFEHFNINMLMADQLIQICAEENGQLIISGHKSLYKFDMKQKKLNVFYHEHILPESFCDYKKDEQGIEWIAMWDGLIRYNPTTKKSFVFDSSFLTHNPKEPISFSRVILLPDGYLLASTFNLGLLLVNRKTNAFKQFPVTKINPEAPLPQINPISPVKDRGDCIYKLNDSIILCSIGGGVSVFNWRTEAVTYFKSDKQDPSSLLEGDIRIYSIFKDREGIIWLGGDHLEKYDFRDYKINIIPQNWKQYNPKQFAQFIELFRRANGEFLLESYGSVSSYNPLTGLKNINNRIGINFFNEDARGNIWCSMQGGIGVFTLTKNMLVNIVRYKISDDGVNINCLKIDRKGRVLAATGNKGLAIFDTSSKTFAFFDANSRPPSQLTTSVTNYVGEDHNGCIWIGTPKGINKIEKDGITVKQYSQNKKNTPLQPDWNVRTIKEDKHGIIWFTTLEHGIGRIDPVNDSVRFFSIAEGMPTCWFRELCIDDEDNLWARSKMGIVNLNVTTLQNKLYTEEEGFPSPDDINTIHYSNYTKKLYILTPYAIYEIDTKNTDHNNKIPQTTITGFSVFDKEKPFVNGSNISLKYNENFIDLQFACLLFHSNRQIKYAYKMDGIDNDWVYCNYKRNASYTSLPPGHYIFNVKAQSPDGIWNSSPTQLSIVIQPPLWQTWWFYSLELLVTLSIIFWLIRLYTRRKLAKQKNEFERLRAVSDERTRIASEMHDELGSGLTSIRMLSEIAGGKIDHDITVRSEIEKIEKSATNLSENLREIIWTMNTRFDKLDDFIIYVRSYAVEFFDESPIHFQFTAPDMVPEITLNGELRRNVFLCIKEALNNIMKHSKATDASLTIDLSELTNLVIEIKDNGIGIGATQMNKFGNGLTTMKERLKKFGSEMEIETSGGTRLTFKINI